jgi:hypothetical protein
MTGVPNVSENPHSYRLSAMYTTREHLCPRGKARFVPACNVARMERSGMRDSCRSHHTPSWTALRFIQATHLPTVIYAVSVIVLGAAILLVILGGARLDILIQW